MALGASIWNDGEFFCVQTTYNIALIRVLNTLPPSEAFYRDETRTWYIKSKHQEFVKSVLRELGYLVTHIDQAMPVPVDEDFAVLGLLPTAVWEVCESAYKALCRIHHPDMGGNLETMQAINQAWERVKLSKGK